MRIKRLAQILETRHTAKYLGSESELNITQLDIATNLYKQYPKLLYDIGIVLSKTSSALRLITSRTEKKAERTFSILTLFD
jgi:hypothetical protein